MKNHLFNKQNVFVIILFAALLITALYPGGSYASTMRDQQARVYSSDPVLVLPAELPVFKILDKPVNSETARGLANRFNGIAVSDVISTTSHTGTPLYIAHSERSDSVLEQYGATGGFFAYNATQAFQETEANLDYGPQTICFYLQDSKLFPADTTPENRDCSGQNLTYKSSPIYLSTLSPEIPLEGFDFTVTQVISQVIVIGELWQVPLAVEVGRYLDQSSPLYIPMGGPGGHLSLLLTGYDDRVPLDADLPGLQALAMPSFEQEKILIGLYKVIQPEAAALAFENQVLSAMPGVILDLGEPELIYYVDDAAVDQEAMLPVWSFPEATAIVDGEEVNLRGFTVPAVEGFVPEVQITSPEDGTIIFAGSAVDIAATISGGEAPFTYVLELEDGTVLASGESEGSDLIINSGPLPEDLRPEEAGIFLNLVVTDTNGASGFDSVMINTNSLNVYVPLISQQAAAQDFSFQPNLPSSTSAARTMGVEWVRYYNGNGSNLPGTQPDGTGFFNSLKSLGWTGVFHWSNNNAWEKDWRDCSLGGIDCSSGVDRAEFIYFAGHGSPARIYFGGSKDSTNFFAGNARYQNVRWAGFATCQTMRAGPYVSPGNPPLTNWFNSFQGSYMLLGFHSNMSDVAFGPRFISNAKVIDYFFFTQQRTIREAWVLTAFQMNAGKPAYLYARSNNFNPVNMKLPNNGTPTPPLSPGLIVGYNWVWWD